MNWDAPIKPAEIAEQRITQAILNNHFPINSNLPSERELAALIGVTRPTLRETLQRLARDGWIEIHHGKSTRVRDFWKEGNISVLESIAKYQDQNETSFVPNLLQIRYLLSPTYTEMAIKNNPENIVVLLQQSPTIESDNNNFSNFDLSLHQSLAINSGNPVFTLILNGFKELIGEKGKIYFNMRETRQHSINFYIELLHAAEKHDSILAKIITEKVMLESMQFWLTLDKD